MSTSKHTPGPWKAFNCIGPRILKNWHIQADELKGRPVSTIADIGDGDAANAHLIAAAPELLEALVAALRYLEIHADCPRTRNFISLQLKPAIAKAKGQS